MKRFLLLFLAFIGIPIVIALVIFLCTDPFKTLHQFDLHHCNTINREYLSTELFLKNYSEQKYNSFVFSSSRGGGLNTYKWKSYLPDSSNVHQFLFQGWSENLTGIDLKISYLDKNNVELKNVIVMLDIPSAFNKEQYSTKALDMKHYIFTEEPKWMYNARLFNCFLQKPSSWVDNIKIAYRNDETYIDFDTISNDWEINNRFNLSECPKQDSLSGCSAIGKKTFFEEIKNKTDDDLLVSQPLINDDFKNMLIHIKSIFDIQRTNYIIILSPGYCYTQPKVNPEDLQTLQSVFGQDKVYDFTGKNELTSDYNNFSDPNHFGLCVGWKMMEQIFHK